ncbi:hypothetical protein Tco_1224565 [Tanacetum coccineum]
MDKSESYLAAPKYRECYDGLIKSYDLDKNLFSTYDKVYSLKKSRKTEGTKSQPKSFGKSIQSEEPEFEVADSDMPQDQEENLGQTQSWLMTLASYADKPSKTFNELMSTPIDFSAYIMNGLKITNLTQESLLGPAFRLLKGTHTNYAELEYEFEECYKALSEKLDWENPEGGDYPFDLTKPIPLFMSGNCQKVPVDYFFNNDLKESDIGENNVEVMRKHGYGYLKEIVVRRADNDLYTFKEGDFTSSSVVIQKRVEDLQAGVESYQKKINVTKPETTKPGIRKKDPYTPYQDPQGFIYVDTLGRNSNDLRVLRIILVVLLEHQSDTKVIHNDDGNPSRANIKQALARNPINEVLLKLNLPDHKLILMDSKYEHVGSEVTRSQEGKRSQDDDKRLGLVDDLKEVQDLHATQAY